MPDTRTERLNQIANDYCDSLGFYAAAHSIRAVAEERDRLQSRAANPVVDWQPIETAPEDVDFLVYCRSGYISRGRLVGGKYLAADSFEPCVVATDTTVTHWARLPAPPQSE